MVTRDFVSTVFIVDKEKVLLLFHKKLNTWLPPGGHIDENEIPCDAAKREVFEETGLKVSLIGKEEELGKGVKKLVQPKLIQLEDIKEGHQHINLVYFGVIENGDVILNKEEGSDIRWFSVKDLENKGIIESVRVYGKKAIEELNNPN